MLRPDYEFTSMCYHSTWCGKVRKGNLTTKLYSLQKSFPKKYWSSDDSINGQSFQISYVPLAKLPCFVFMNSRFLTVNKIPLWKQGHKCNFSTTDITRVFPTGSEFSDKSNIILKDCCAQIHYLLCERQRLYHCVTETQLKEKNS